MRNENEAYEELLCGHLEVFVHRLREIPADKWEWQPAVPAPSARILAQHAWCWLVCDRQHILEADLTKHRPTPEPPANQQAMCDRLQEECAHWEALISSLTAEQFAASRRQFGRAPVNVRWFVHHMIQNVIYKHGQLATIYFALGLDGHEPYKAPFPNDFYE